MALEHLKFFDKNGNNITPSISNGIYKFNIFFDSISTSLFSSEHIFILEEVYKEYEGNGLPNKKADINTPIIIKIMRFIKDYEDAVDKTQLYRFFPTLSVDVDYIDNFIKRYSNYIISIIKPDGNIYYSLSNVGLDYLDSYTNKEIELYLDNDRLYTELVKPRSNFDPSLEEDSYLFFRWKDDNFDKNIHLYYINSDDDQLYYENDKCICLDYGKKFPSIVPVYNKDITPSDNNDTNWKRWFEPYRFDSGIEDSFIFKNKDGSFDTKSNRVLPNDVISNQKPFQINFALNSDIEGEYIRILDVFIVRKIKNKETNKFVSNIYQVAEITLCGEVVGEDERLKLLLENFGRKIDESDCYILRDSDIDDELPDYIYLNQKRKELLLTGDEIYNYLGSYKGFVNAMKFLGYSDLRLKEYFINTNLTKPTDNKIYYSTVEVPLEFKYNEEYNEDIDYNTNIFGTLLDNNTFVKSSRFGLYYDINRDSGNVDDYGFPIIEDAFSYTNEEILIKLYGLKKLLQKYYLPHHARIIDITGEGIYFAKYNIKNWNDSLTIFPIEYESKHDFEGYPRKGHLKHLDRLLNIFRKSIDEINDIETLNNDDILSEIYDKSLSEFILTNRFDYVFDSEITLDTIKKYFPDYFKLKNAIYDNLRNSKCSSNSNTTTVNKKSNITNTIIGTIKLMGLPVVLKFIPMRVCIDDLDVKIEDMENINGPKYIGDDLINDRLKLAFDIERVSSINNEDKKEYEKRFLSHSKLTEIDNLTYKGFNSMSWRITHDKGKYCYSTSGTVNEVKEIMLFLPNTGFYDVECILRNDSNFPLIVKKAKYFEVLENNGDFVAIGQFTNNKKTIDELSDVSIDSFNGSLDSMYCPLKSKIKEAKITIDDLNPMVYYNQFFVNDVKNTEILDINEQSGIITLSGTDYYDDYKQYRKQHVRDVLVLERFPDLVPEKEDISISKLNKNRIELNGLYDIKIGDKINIYRYFETSNFVIDVDNDKIRILYSSINIDTSYEYNVLESFFTNNNIKLYRGDNYNSEYYFIKDVNILLDENYVDVYIENDGSLKDFPFNKLNFTGDSYIFKITNITLDKDNNITILEVDDNANNFIIDIMNDNIYYKAKWGIYSGRYVFDIANVVLDNNNTLVYIKDNNNICNITTTFIAKWVDKYDFDYAERFATNRLFYVNNLDNVSIDTLDYLRSDMLHYHSSSICGFKITNIIHNTGFIRFDDNLFEFKLTSRLKNERLAELCNVLNNSTHECVSMFNYYLIYDVCILGVAKFGGYRSMFNIQHSNSITCEKSTYPKTFFSDWSNMFYSGYNNKAYWNYLNYDKENSLNSSFAINDVFIESDDFRVPLNTTLHIVYSLTEDVPVPLNYYWELWEETKNKMICKSDLRYIVFTFIDKGIYTVKLRFIDENSNEKSLTKKSWIRVG